MSHLWSSIVHKLTPYVPGEQPKIKELIKLNTNENPYPPSNKVLKALKESADSSLRLYPDPNAEKLKSTLTGYLNNTHQITLKCDQIFVGNGSDEVLAHTFCALLKQKNPILLPDISYSFYPVYSQLYDVPFTTIPLDEKFQIDVDDYFTDANKNNGGIIFPNPNAPTGLLLKLEKIETLLQQNVNSVVVIDEAYIDFGGESAISLVDKYPNLLVIQTFSKSRSLAGLRVGFAVGHADLIEALERVKNSFNSYPLDKFAQAGAIAAIEDNDYFMSSCKKIVTSRDYLTREMTAMNFNILPSSANFLFVSHAEYNAEKLAVILREKNILVRHFKQPRIDQYLRITVGTQEECEMLVKEFKAFLT